MVHIGISGRAGCALAAALLLSQAQAFACQDFAVEADRALAGRYDSVIAVDDPDQPLNKVPTGQLESFVRIVESFERHSRIDVLPIVCGGPPGAWVQFTNPAYRISISAEMLDLIGNNHDALATVIGHEFGHILAKHYLPREKDQATAIDKAIEAANEVYQRTGNRDQALKAGERAGVATVMAFSRAREHEADTLGVQLAAELGFDPHGAIWLMETFRELVGDVKTSWLDTHPGFSDRLHALQPVVQQENFNLQARDQLDKRRWPALRAHVNEWLKLHPADGRGWYYRGLVLDALKGAGSAEAFEKAVTYRPNLQEAWLHLCIALHREGYRSESLYCAGRLNAESLEKMQKVIGQLIVAGGDVYAPTTLWVGRDENGNSIITSESSILQAHDLPATRVPPPWKAIRPVKGAGTPKP